MTQEEVDLIYEYLHENYEYVDGELINKKNAKSLGTFRHANGSPSIVVHLVINKKHYKKSLAQTVWIYKNKEYTPYFYFKDNNPTNCKIENITKCSKEKKEIDKMNKAKGYILHKTKSGKIRYRARIQIGKTNKILIWFGSHETKEEAIKVYQYAKKLVISEPNLNPIEIKEKVKNHFSNTNIKLSTENKLGFPGIYKQGNRYIARIQMKDKVVKKSYLTPEEAHEAYIQMKKDYENPKTLPTTNA